MNTIHTQQTASVGATKVLHGGSSVFVRVIAENGGGKYTVSFAGNRVDVQLTSKVPGQTPQPLTAGQTFLATVQAGADGKILLVPRNDAGPLHDASSLQNGAYITGTDSDNILVSSQLQSVVLPDGTPNAALASFLAAQGLVPDAATVKVLQFLQQTGVKTDIGLMQKARAIASHFPGRESQAAEAAILLLEKGVEPDDALVEKLLLLFDEMNGGERDGSGGERDGSSGERNESGSETERTFLNGLYENGPQHEAGLLALVNQLSCGEKHWLFLPYEWQYEKKDGENGEMNTAKGVIRVLLDTETQKIEKIALNCKTTLTNYFFVLYYTTSKVKEVRFCTLPPLLPSRGEELRLGELLRSGMNLDSSVAVTYSTSAYCDGFCTEETPPLFIADEQSTAREEGV